VESCRILARRHLGWNKGNRCYLEPAVVTTPELSSSGSLIVQSLWPSLVLGAERCLSRIQRVSGAVALVAGQLEGDASELRAVGMVGRHGR